MMTELLKKLQENEIIASLSWNDCGMQVGKVLGWNDEMILLAHISAGGYYDGYVLRPLLGLSHITYGGQYENKIQKLYLEKAQSHEFLLEPNASLLSAILEYARKKELIVTVEIGDSSVTGFVEGWTDTELNLRAVNSVGEADGFALILLEEMDLLAVDTDYEQDLRLL